MSLVVEVEDAGGQSSEKGHRHGEVVFQDLEEELQIDAEGDQVFSDFGAKPAALVGHGVDGTDGVAGTQLKLLIRICRAAVHDAAERKQKIITSIADVPENFAFGKVNLLNVAREVGDRVDLAVAERKCLSKECHSLDEIERPIRKSKWL